MPSKNSKEAPPPVEICVILSSNPAFFTAAAESPPPIIVFASIVANNLAIAFVPTENCGNSNSPSGPFQITVFAFLISSVKIFIVSSPISNPSQSAGISVHGTVLLSVSGLNSFPTFVSTGKTRFTPFALAFAIASFARSSLSNSQIEFPTSYPCALKNVYAIPPPISNVSTFSNKLSITPILSETFAPPNIATNGLSGLFIASPKHSNSFSIKNPETAGKNFATPAVEACALCAAPNASFTYTSAKLANSFANPSSLSVSSLWNLTFSNNITSPDFKLAAFVLASSPITSSAIITSLPNILDNSFATGFKENSGLNSPFGLPKCEQRIIAQSFSNKYFIVGIAAIILVVSVIFFSSSIGTLKSHLTNTFFPFKSMSLTVFFISISSSYLVILLFTR